MMTQFTPIELLLGGMLIGLAALMLWLGNRKIAGISGIVANLASAVAGDRAWRVAFLAGLLVAPMLAARWIGTVPVAVTGHPGLLVLAGLLVGFGTVLGNGCTSGHGVCGLARLSPRSMAATGTFIVMAVLTVFVLRHVVG